MNVSEIAKVKCNLHERSKEKCVILELRILLVWYWEEILYIPCLWFVSIKSKISFSLKISSTFNSCCCCCFCYWCIVECVRGCFFLYYCLCVLMIRFIFPYAQIICNWHLLCKDLNFDRYWTIKIVMTIEKLRNVIW